MTDPEATARLLVAIRDLAHAVALLEARVAELEDLRGRISRTETRLIAHEQVCSGADARKLATLLDPDGDEPTRPGPGAKRGQRAGT